MSYKKTQLLILFIIGFGFLMYGYITVINEQDDAIITSLKFSINGAEKDQKEAIYVAFLNSEIVKSRFLTKNFRSQLKSTYDIYSFGDRTRLWSDIVMFSVNYQKDRNTLYTNGKWVSAFETMKYTDLVEIDIDKYRNDLSKIDYKNYKNLITQLRVIIASGLSKKKPEQLKNEIVLKLASKGLSVSGQDIELEGSIGAQFWLRLNQKLRRLKYWNKEGSVTIYQIKKIVKKMLVPVYIETLLLDRVYPAGGVNEKLLDGNRLYVKKENVPESVINQALGIIKSNKSKNVSNSDMLELAANILVFGYKDGAKRWLRINNFNYLSFTI